MSISWLTQPYGDVLHTPPYGIRQIPGRNVTTKSWDGVGVITPASQNPILIKEDYFQGVIRAPGPFIIYEASPINGLKRAHIKAETGRITVVEPPIIYTPDQIYDANGAVKFVKIEPTKQEVGDALKVANQFSVVEFVEGENIPVSRPIVEILMRYLKAQGA